MYSELYEAWLRERSSGTLQLLPDGFQEGLLKYFGDLKGRTEALEKGSLTRSLLEEELGRSTLLVRDLFALRWRKMGTVIEESKGEKPPTPLREESSIRESIAEARRALESTVSTLTGAAPPRMGGRAVLRFMKDAPAIVGGDMKGYGPFKAEEIICLPLRGIENLIKSGIVKRVEMS